MCFDFCYLCMETEAWKGKRFFPPIIFEENKFGSSSNHKDSDRKIILVHEILAVIRSMF